MWLLSILQDFGYVCTSFLLLHLLCVPREQITVLDAESIRVKFRKEDIVLIVDDFDCVWHGDERDDEGLNWLEGHPFTPAFVTGNYDALRRYPLRSGAAEASSESAPR